MSELKNSCNDCPFINWAEAGVAVNEAKNTELVSSAVNYLSDIYIISGDAETDQLEIRKEIESVGITATFKERIAADDLIGIRGIKRYTRTVEFLTKLGARRIKRFSRLLDIVPENCPGGPIETPKYMHLVGPKVPDCANVSAWQYRKSYGKPQQNTDVKSASSIMVSETNK